jgi:succinoglycan biosynthesis protein ExoA
MPPIISVIVPVRNEQRSIRRTLDSLLTQDFPKGDYEVIVADGYSEDETTSIVRELQGTHANLKLVYNSKRWSSAGRNLGVRHMSGRFAVIVDGHCHVPDKQYLRNVVKGFTESGADCLGRPQPLDAPEPTPFQAAVSLARSSRLGHNPDSDIFSNEAKFVPPQSTAVAYQREVFETVGLFDEQFDACEDVEFNQRVADASQKCYFTPSIKIVYDPRVNFRGLFTQLARYGAGRARLAAKHPHSLTIPAIVPPLWCVWLVVGAALSFLHPLLMWSYLGSIALYATVILGASLWLGRRQPPQILARIPLVFLGIHFGFSWGFLREVWKRCWRR